MPPTSEPIDGSVVVSSRHTESVVLHYQSGTSDKVYYLGRLGALVHILWGRTSVYESRGLSGLKGKVYYFDYDAEAIAFYQSKLAAQTMQGYTRFQPDFHGIAQRSDAQRSEPTTTVPSHTRRTRTPRARATSAPTPTNTDWQFGWGVEYEALPAFRQKMGELKPAKTSNAYSHRGNVGIKTDGKYHTVSVSDGSVPEGYELVTYPGKHSSGGLRIEEGGFKNSTAKKIIDLMRETEKQVLDVEKASHPNKELFMHPFCTEFHTTRAGGTGSYHISLTVPYKEGIPKQANQKKISEFYSQMQWIAPLIVSKIGGASPGSIGDWDGKRTNSEGSVRTAEAGWGNPGSVDPEELASGLHDHGDEVTQVGDVARYYATNPKWREVFKVRIKKDSDTHSDASSRKMSDDNGRRVVGAVPGCGIEMRFMDRFDSQGLYPLSKVISTLFVNKLQTGKIIKGAGGWEIDGVQRMAKHGAYEWKSSYTNAMARVMEEGWNAQLPKEYVKELKEALGLSFESKSLRAADVMDEVSKELWQKHGENEVVRKVVGGSDWSVPILPNFNKDSWEYFFRSMLLNEAGRDKTRDRLYVALAGLPHMSYEKGEEKWLDAGNKGKGFNEVVNGVLGKNWGEDERDIINYLEDAGILEVKYNPDKTIDKVRLKVNDEELPSKLAEALKNTDLFSKQTHDLGIKEPEKVGPPVPAPNVSFRPLLSLSEIQPRLNELKIKVKEHREKYRNTGITVREKALFLGFEINLQESENLIDAGDLDNATAVVDNLDMSFLGSVNSLTSEKLVVVERIKEKIQENNANQLGVELPSVNEVALMEKHLDEIEEMEKDIKRKIKTKITAKLKKIIKEAEDILAATPNKTIINNPTPSTNMLRPIGWLRLEQYVRNLNAYLNEADGYRLSVIKTNKNEIFKLEPEVPSFIGANKWVVVSTPIAEYKMFKIKEVLGKYVDLGRTSWVHLKPDVLTASDDGYLFKVVAIREANQNEIDAFNLRREMPRPMRAARTTTTRARTTAQAPAPTTISPRGGTVGTTRSIDEAIGGRGIYQPLTYKGVNVKNYSRRQEVKK